MCREGCESGVKQGWMFVSCDGEKRSSFSSANTFQILETVYHLILLVPPLVASGIENDWNLMIVSQDGVKVLVTPIQSLS